VNAVDAGAAWSAGADAVAEAKGEVERLGGELDTLQESLAGAWNPRLVAYYNAEIANTEQALRDAQAVARADPAADMATRLADQMKLTREYSRRVRQLRQMGLAESAIDQVLALGPEAGVELADLLVNDAELRRQFAAVYQEAGSLSRDAGKAFAADTGRAMKRLVGDLKAAMKAWPDELRRLLEREEFKIKVGFETPKAPPPIPLPRQRRQVIEQNVHVTVEGHVVDPEGSARAIKKLLDDSARRNGKKVAA
jgi:hypothetical protein